MWTAWLWAAIAAMDAGLATGNLVVGLAVFCGLGSLLVMGKEIIKALKK